MAGCPGIPGRIKSVWVAGCYRNHRPDDPGIRSIRESAQSWRELLVDIKNRGLSAAPEIAVGDGAMGFWKALSEIFPSTKHQRCWPLGDVNIACQLTGP